MKILLGEFNATLGRKNMFKPRIGSENLHQDSNDNGVRIVNSTTLENMVVKSTMFHYHNIHNCTWTSPDGKTHYHIYNVLIGDGILIYKMYELSGEPTVILIAI